jgi:hypothetical protein
MSEENFFERWSRRKRAAAAQGEKATSADDSPAERTVEQSPDEQCAPAPAEKTEPSFDPASLPSIDSINAISDIRAFLAPGVPAELTRAALRRAWVADPAIRDFVGLSENAWDFTAPGGVPGFEAFGEGDDLRRFIAHLTHGSSEDVDTLSQAGLADASQAAQSTQDSPPAAEAAPAPDHPDTVSVEPPDDLLQDNNNDAAAQRGDARGGTSGSGRRGHGGALPE